MCGLLRHSRWTSTSSWSPCDTRLPSPLIPLTSHVALVSATAYEPVAWIAWSAATPPHPDGRGWALSASRGRLFAGTYAPTSLSEHTRQPRSEGDELWLVLCRRTEHPWWREWRSESPGENAHGAVGSLLDEPPRLPLPVPPTPIMLSRAGASGSSSSHARCPRVG